MQDKKTLYILKHWRIQTTIRGYNSTLQEPLDAMSQYEKYERRKL